MLLDSLTEWSHSNFLLGAIIISNPFVLFKEGTVTRPASWCQVSWYWFSKTSLHLSLSTTTLGCNTSAVGVSVVCHVVICPRPSQTMYFSLPKSCMVICHIVSNHWFECSVFLIHSAWTFASSVLVCNNQMFLYGVVIRWLPCDYLFTFNERVWLDWVRG